MEGMNRRFLNFLVTTSFLMLFCFSGLTFGLPLIVILKGEYAGEYEISNNIVEFGISAARMSATLVGAASFYASPASGFQDALPGPSVTASRVL
jgi:hypothetical protein